MSDDSIAQPIRPRPNRLMRIAIRIAPIYRCFLVVLALISVKRWFEGKHDGWQVLFDFGFFFLIFRYMGTLSATYGPEKASPQAEDPS